VSATVRTDPPAGASWEDLALAAARPADAVRTSALQRELLVLWIAGDPYAVPVERVREIVRMRPITPVPGVPACVAGVVSLRGDILQVVDLRRRLGVAPDRGGPDVPTRRRRIVVLHGEDGQLCGLLVDRVSAVIRVAEPALRAVPGGHSDTVAALCAHDARFVSLFDVDRLLDLGSDSPAREVAP
jgi:purine-binding chemotaxis protein CheW